MSPDSGKNVRTMFHFIHSVRLELGSLLLSVALQGSSTLRNISRPLQVRTGNDLRKLHKADGESSQILCALTVVTDT